MMKLPWEALRNPEMGDQTPKYYEEEERKFNKQQKWRKPKYKILYIYLLILEIQFSYNYPKKRVCSTSFKLIVEAFEGQKWITQREFRFTAVYINGNTDSNGYQ